MEALRRPGSVSKKFQQSQTDSEVRVAYFGCQSAVSESEKGIRTGGRKVTASLTQWVAWRDMGLFTAEAMEDVAASRDQ